MEHKEKLKEFGLKVKTFFLKYWYLFAAVIVFIVLVFILKTSNGQKLYEQLMSKYHELLGRKQKEVEQLDEIRHDQVVKDRQIEEKYSQVVEQIRTEHAEQLEIIDEIQEQEIKLILEETKDDPDKMAEKINNYFGLPIYRGKDE
jgi:hypothetical protein